MQSLRPSPQPALIRSLREPAPRRSSSPTSRQKMRVTEVSLRRVETSELWSLRHEAGEAAREELVRRFLPLVRKLASRYRSANEPFDDLLQVASLGLLHAIDRFDPDRGTPFVSYAIPTILGELKRHFRDTGWAVRVPRGAKELALRVEQTSREMTDRLGRPPRVDELSQFMKVGAEDVLDALQASQARYGMSLDAPISNAESDLEVLGDTVGAGEDQYAVVDTRIDLAACIRRLPYLERKALALRVGQDLKQRDIAERLGCSQMQVSRLLIRATSRLKASGGAP
jgi:RNA polymerase sigma-B factor